MHYRLIGIDLAKNVFQVCAVNEHLKPQLNKRLRRKELIPFLCQQCPTTIVIESCYSAHYWAREIEKLGHTVHQIPAQHVTPFVRGNKNDSNDAYAIVEASQRSFIRYVPNKTLHQQEILALHRVRERLIKNKTALTNQARGLLSDVGIIMPTGAKAWVIGIESVIQDKQQSTRFKRIFERMYHEYKKILSNLKEIEKELKDFANTSNEGKILLSIPGVGVICAPAFSASIDTGQAFNSAREFAVWMGLTPKQTASGDNSRMGGITKRGDRYLRKQLIHGARAILPRCKDKNDALKIWGHQILLRKGYNKASVAMAHRLARLIWTLLQKQQLYQPQLAINIAT